MEEDAGVDFPPSRGPSAETEIERVSESALCPPPIGTLVSIDKLSYVEIDLRFGWKLYSTHMKSS